MCGRELQLREDMKLRSMKTEHAELIRQHQTEISQSNRLLQDSKRKCDELNRQVHLLQEDLRNRRYVYDDVY